MNDLVIPILVGWALGYLVNYLADVLPVARRFARPACPRCAKTYPTRDYLLLRACTQCGRARGPRPWVVMLTLAGLSLYVWTHPPMRLVGAGLATDLVFAVSVAILTYFATVFVIDVEHRLILHPTSIVGALLGLGAGWLSHGPIATLQGGLAGFGIMLGLYYFGTLFTRYRAKRLQAMGQAADEEEALGAGDVMLGGVLGLALGWPLIWFGLLLGILLGGVVGILLWFALIVSRQYRKNAFMVFIPYGPFLVLSAFFIMFLPNWIVKIVPR